MATARTTRHHEVADRIVGLIKSGRFAVGTWLPGELQLAQEFEVSRSTVRAALAMLRSLGLIESLRGAGTRVVAGEASPVYIHTMRARGDLLQFAGPSTRTILTAEEIVADEILAPRLDSRPGRRWLKIGQTRHVDEHVGPICWTDVYLPIEYRDVLEEARTFPGLIYSLIEQRHNVTVVEIVQTIRPVDIPKHLLVHFGPEVQDGGCMALELTRRYRNGRQGCEMVTISVLPDKYYSYEITMTRQGSETTL